MTPELHVFVSSVQKEIDFLTASIDGSIRLHCREIIDILSTFATNLSTTNYSESRCRQTLDSIARNANMQQKESDGESKISTNKVEASSLVLEKDAAQRLKTDCWLYVVFSCATEPYLNVLRDQSTLDNQLYRAIKELRLLQDRRISMIETVFTADKDETS